MKAIAYAFVALLVYFAILQIVNDPPPEMIVTATVPPLGCPLANRC